MRPQHTDGLSPTDSDVGGGSLYLPMEVSSRELVGLAPVKAVATSIDLPLIGRPPVPARWNPVSGRPELLIRTLWAKRMILWLFFVVKHDVIVASRRIEWGIQM